MLWGDDMSVWVEQVKDFVDEETAKLIFELLREAEEERKKQKKTELIKKYKVFEVLKAKYGIP